MEISESIQNMIMDRLKGDAPIQSDKAKKAIKQNAIKDIIKFFSDEQALYEKEIIPAAIEKIRTASDDKAIKRSVMSIVKGDISEKFAVIADDYADSFKVQATLDDFTNKVDENKKIEDDAKKIRDIVKQKKAKQEQQETAAAAK